MTAVVRLALARPYTFVVMAILVMIFGVLSAIRTPTDIFPNIGITVISVVWSYTGLSPEQSRGSGWIVAIHPDDLDPCFVKWKTALLFQETSLCAGRSGRLKTVHA